MGTEKIPDITISRLPIYLRALQRMAEKGLQTTSSQELGELVGVTAAQIRKDISQFGEFGKQGTGYNILFLIAQLREILKLDRIWDMAIIGAGDMGRALARYQGFLDRGFRVLTIFDKDAEKIGDKAGDFIIQDAARMVKMIRQAGIKVAMLTVPVAEAQEVTDQLVQAGVKAILNYAPINLTVPPDIHVQYMDPATHLQWMTYYL
jgi:redox-sensing transcriptional repressor